jgi:hypothetical protein
VYWWQSWIVVLVCGVLLLYAGGGNQSGVFSYTRSPLLHAGV